MSQILPVNIVRSVNFLLPSGGVNPVDVTPQTLHNVRGQVVYQIISRDNNYTSELTVVGGYGLFSGDYTQNFLYVSGSSLNCTVTVPTLNQITVTTPVGDAGGRVYVLQFQPIKSTAPTIQQTSGNVIGNNTLEVRTTRYTPNLDNIPHY
jgi:hypothetical protein